MSLFGSIIGGGLGLAGNLLAGDDREDAAAAALAAAQPRNVVSPLGNALVQGDTIRLALNQQLQRFQENLGAGAEDVLGDLTGVDFEGREAAELERLRTLRRPEIDAARSALQSRLLSRGRIGLGVGGGLSGRLFNPESAALEEAILRSDLGDISAARTMSQQDQQFLLGQLQGLSGIQQSVLSGPERLAAIGLGARPPAAVSTLQAAPGMARADFTSGFFTGLGNEIANTDFRDLARRFRSGGLSGLFF